MALSIHIVFRIWKVALCFCFRLLVIIAFFKYKKLIKVCNIVLKNEQLYLPRENVVTLDVF